MEYLHAISDETFDNDLQTRNQFLLDKGFKSPTTHKTGTTIVGLVFPGGVIIGADTRATSGSTVFDKNCEKLHYISPNISCAGAGTAADTEFVTKNIAAQMDLMRLTTGRPTRVATVVTRVREHLFRHGGFIGAYLIMCGLDPTGPWLYQISADGASIHAPYLTMGSGSVAAMSVFETKYREDFTVSHI